MLDVESSTAGARIYNTTTNGQTDLHLRTAGTTGSSRIFFGDTADSDIGSIIYRHNGNSLAFETNDEEQVRIDSDGNVGIGETVPGEKLTVAGNISACGGLSATEMNSYFACNVGIGTCRPAVPFHVKSTTCNTKMRLTNDNSTNWDFTVGNSGYYQGNLFISNPAISNEQFTLGSTGNVGINVFNPGQRLTVGGNISASGNGYFACVIAGGYFEQKAANETLACYPTGTLVVIGKCGDLIQSTRENDKKVFGVTQNGVCQPIVLGAEPVLVTGDIKIGDYITTSDKPGHGRKTRDPVYGSVIAQSMEAGTGDSHLVKAMIRKM